MGALKELRRKTLRQLQKKKLMKRLQDLSEIEIDALLDFERALKHALRKKRGNYRERLWELYPKFVRTTFCSLQELDKEYAQKGYKQWQISKESVDHFKRALKGAAITRIICSKECALDAKVVSIQERLVKSHDFYKFEAEQFEAVKSILEELKWPVARCLGSPWKVINLAVWKTQPKAEQFGPNSWHCDGIPVAINKVLVYLNGASMEKGTTELKLDDGTKLHAEGPEGTCMLFKVSEILHRGVSPTVGERLVLEVRLLPSFEFDLEPCEHGFLNNPPSFPWQR
ncbi:MAG: hypothetical protein H7A36_05800 [Chlamydiales bacterium]|nr:hypothetical protein [Chlamydiales bacterium]